MNITRLGICISLAIFFDKGCEQKQQVSTLTYH